MTVCSSATLTPETGPHQSTREVLPIRLVPTNPQWISRTLDRTRNRPRRHLHTINEQPKSTHQTSTPHASTTPPDDADTP